MSDKEVDEIIKDKSLNEKVEDHDDILVKQLCEGLDTYRKN